MGFSYLWIREKIFIGSIFIYMAGHMQRANAEPLLGQSLSINVSGIPMKVPIDYIPTGERKLYREGQRTEGLRVQVMLPGMEPYTIPDDNRPLFIRYKNHAAILLSPSGGIPLRLQKEVFKKLSKSWLENHNYVETHAGLKRFVLRAHVRSAMEDDVYLNSDSDSDSTIILCTPQDVPDPESAEADSARKKRLLVKNPFCQQMFFVPGLDGVQVTVSYFRRHLDEWKEIRNHVSDLLYKFSERNK